MLHFRAHVVDGVAVVEFLVPGICDGPEIEELTEELHELIGRSETKKMVIDLSRVRFLASRAVALIVNLKQLIEVHNGELLVCGIGEQLLRVFRLSGLERLFSVHATRDQALAALAETA
jgi:anti-anti-sigma factor